MKTGILNGRMDGRTDSQKDRQTDRQAGNQTETQLQAETGRTSDTRECHMALQASSAAAMSTHGRQTDR